jgi:quaternary ammonium compound-resistance protein SugE
MFHFEGWGLVSSVAREVAMAWVVLVVAGLVEVAWAVGLKYTVGFTRLVPSVLTIGGGLVSFFLLAQAARTLPIGTAYAVWTGIGAVGTAVLGMILFEEPRDWARLACIGLVVVGIVGLKLTTVR